MSTEQEADAYGQELARFSHHQHEATDARFMVFRDLSAVGIGHEQADDIVAKLEAGAVAGAHTWISESSPPRIRATVRGRLVRRCPRRRQLTASHRRHHLHRPARARRLQRHAARRPPAARLPRAAEGSRAGS
ncbi:hypothetical protein ABZ516_32655 [Streptomyces sp. NPDC019826]|uniref:hypothetical protein n=1 Tax=Streptomyces TaxID=1883 RepID=UPI0004BE4365|nr:MULTISPECIES: hypothetical protein [Streptomyces]MDX3186609.1 hypothetical protein [Streptomyces sp. ME02-7008A-1]MDX3307369.1 hypothetical protein [Streptomyces sp. ME02-7008A]QBR04643.1 hypothetical protein D7Y56_01080 [Streptomyces sp. S501]WSZ45839.1 hypothetical protein OG337_00105 [[Kitasatospora] papulosa]